MADGEGAGDAAGTGGAEWAGSGEGEAAEVGSGVLDDWGEAAAEESTVAGTTGEPLLCSGVAGLRGSFTLSRGAGEEVR